MAAGTLAVIATSPDNTAVMDGPPPLYGMWRSLTPAL
jgi:hypothetical protein